ncbi:DUF4294 domain-containing protein [Halpernia frigidisoli]|uniref:Molecular chaperone DnaJ n=1 Tax=Halpernia frigidisoli TaxID=1125876 RepID=A0A1I3DCR9_9FLAO|nr:DUF4294 domain-containing protein [Halpernia frigidisoli]SFH84348.1 protein of unknown function [Halpernia frigidisoli]
MKLYRIFLVIFFFSCLNKIAAQDSLVTKSLDQYPPEMIKIDEFGDKYVYDEAQKAKIYSINGETVVVMDELILAGKPHFNNQLDQNYYFFLNKKLNRVYPLFVEALEEYQDIQQEVKSIDADKRKEYIKDRQNILADSYEARLKDLTTSEGQIFAKLMYRATDKTVFDIIKELRGGWSSFWWNVKGNIADIDIKEPYDPHANRVDEFTESLLQSNWNAGLLLPYPGAQNYRVKK